MPADFPALQSRYRQRLPRAKDAPRRPPRPPRSGEEAHRVRLGRAGHALPARAPRRARADAVRRLRLPRRCATAPGSAGELHLARLGPEGVRSATISSRASTTWRRSRGRDLRHNFLRFNVTPADLDWFDDHAAVVANARLAAGLARAGHCAGILLDTEAYQGKLFDYSRQRRAAPRALAGVRRPGPAPRRES